MTFWGERSFGVLRAHFLFLGDRFVVILRKFWSSFGIKKGGWKLQNEIGRGHKSLFC